MDHPKSPIRVRAALACRIVNLDRVKFNDAVASGTYPCAPETRSGSARIFTEAELLPLFFFARLTEFGFSAGRAGRLACEMAQKAEDKSSEPATRIIVVQMASGYVFPVANKVKDLATGEVKEKYEPGREHSQDYRGDRVIETHEFYIKNVRDIIALRLSDEQRILGEEEDEAE